MPPLPHADAAILPTLREHAAAFFAGFDESLYPAAQALAATGTYRFAERGSVLLRKGEVATDFYFMHRGAVRNYLARGRHGVTTWLTLDTNLVTAMASMSSGDPSLETIETLEDCELLVFAAADLERAYREIAGAERLGRLIVEHYFREMTERLYQNAITTTRERYVDLLVKNPEIVARVPLTVIAGYLQMTPESLSRVRAQVAKGA